jgi:membrane-bound ClpP family serine protease
VGIPPGSSRSEYHRARQASGLLLFLVAAALVMIDAFRTDFEASPLVLVPLMVVGAALFSVDVPGIRKDR